MNAGPKELPHHLDMLREKLPHPTDYEQAVFYLEQADVGAVAFMAPRSGENQIARFQIKNALLGADPTNN